MADRDETWWVAQFDMPFMISIGDSMSDSVLALYVEELEAGMQPAAVPHAPRLGNSMAIGPSIHMPDQLIEPVVVRLDEGVVQLRTLRRIRNVDVPFVMGGELRPCYGQSTYSSVQAEFDLSLSLRLDGRWDDAMDAAADLALEATNCLLAEYRYRCDAFWAQPLTRDAVASFRFFVSDGESLQPRSLSRPPGGPVRGLGSEPLLAGERLDAVRHSLWSQDDDPQPARDIFFMAMEHRSRRRYRNAVIDCSVAFETFVAEYIQIHGEVAGWSAEAVSDAFFKEPNGRWCSISQTLRRLKNDPVNVEFVSTGEFQKWREDVAGPRNALVHGELGFDNREIADKAIESAQAAIKKLQDLKTYM